MNINPFDTIITNNTISTTKKLWLENNGKHKTTHLSGLLKINDDPIEKHLSLIKKKFGCSGKINGVDNDKVLVLQGDQTNNLLDYFKQLNITDICVNKI